VLIDNYVYLTTHSIFLRDLGKNQDLTVKFASEAAISNGNIMLSKDKVFLYDNVILMCTSLQDLPETNDFNLRTFYDAGNNIMFLADFDTSLWFRNLAKDLGFSLSSAEQYLQDYPNALNTQDPSVFYVSPKENNILFPGQIDLKTTKNSLGKYITNLINM
jgi:Oligosaccharyltransferase 48 kDa subunit beta